MEKYFNFLLADYLTNYLSSERDERGNKEAFHLNSRGELELNLKNQEVRQKIKEQIDSFSKIKLNEK